jgi:glycosyltransferase involved in cell wall biosynthesis
LVERFAISAGKLFLVPWGVDRDIRPLGRRSAREQVRARFGLDVPFVLFCGCIEPKKNLPAAIKACAAAGILLVIVGPSVRRSERQLGNRSPGQGAACVYLGFVSPTDLSALYSCASALVFPSLVEGFGLPPLEAMHCGCPVIASTAEAVIEVCAGAAIHVPAEDAQALSSSIQRVLESRGLRQDLIGRGTERAGRFTWARAADHFIEALDHAFRR